MVDRLALLNQWRVDKLQDIKLILEYYKDYQWLRTELPYHIKTLEEINGKIAHESRKN